VNYTDLKANIQDIVESTFTDAQLALFVQQAEQKIYNFVNIPALRKNVTGTLTNGNKYLALPTDFLYSYSLAVVDTNGVYNFLLQKDVNFMREAYPNPATTGFPKHYAYFDKDFIILGPTPNGNHTTEFHYGYYPPSIVTAGTTWLGTDFDSALLNGSLMEAARFMKAEQDVVAMYEKEYLQAIALLKQLDGKLKQDFYRAGEPKKEVK
tara:strand:- start:3164 stop:3790 length:627 start_codon:yes stop_codon:yes gene_type:complete